MLKIPFNDVESFLSHSALHFHVLIAKGVNITRASYVNRLVKHSKKLKNKQCPQVAEFCKTIRKNGPKGLWIYDQYCQMLIGAKPFDNCYPLSDSVVETYAKDTYKDLDERQRFIDTRKKDCLTFGNTLGSLDTLKIHICRY
jgi:hypothetical protein